MEVIIKNLNYLNEEKLISGAPIIKGTNQLPKPPIIAGITKKKIIIKPCKVTITLNNWESSPAAGAPNWNLIIKDNKDPIQPAQAEKTKYNVPISLWLVE